MIHDRVPRWFSGIIRPSGFLTQEFTSLSMGEVPRSIRGWGLFAVLLRYAVPLQSQGKGRHPGLVTDFCEIVSFTLFSLQRSLVSLPRASLLGATLT